jgi:hypothetical protein
MKIGKLCLPIKESSIDTTLDHFKDESLINDLNPVEILDTIKAKYQ